MDPSPTSRGHRLAILIDLLRHEPLPAEVLLPRFNRRVAKVQAISIRTVQHDLEWLLEHLGPTVIQRVPRSELSVEPPIELHRHRMFYRLMSGEDLIPVEGEVLFISELEALALAAARAQMTVAPAPGTTIHDEGPLASALGRLMGRLGLKAKDPRVPDVLAVTQSPPQGYDPQVALAVLRAIRLGEGLSLVYAPLNKPPHQVELQPIRVVLVDGEPYLWAWDAAACKLKNYKIGRIQRLTRREAISEVPSGLDTEVRGALSVSFRGVSGAGQRGRVIVRVAPAGVPHLRQRRLGGSQTWEELPNGGARLSFNTTGIDAVRHWLLQYGADITVEAPLSLVEWMRAETARMAAGYAAK